MRQMLRLLALFVQHTPNASLARSTAPAKGKMTFGLAHSSTAVAVKTKKLLKTEEAPGRLWYTVKLSGKTEIVLQF